MRVDPFSRQKVLLQVKKDYFLDFFLIKKYTIPCAIA